MTVANFESGEVVTVMTEADARTLTGRIRSLAESIADRIDLLVAKVREAQEGHAHVALGYRSWTAYVEAEFAGALPRLDRDPRRELVAVLAETGMSTRAIAPVVGASQKTVDRDIRSGESSDSPTPIAGRDGKTYPAPQAVEAKSPPRRALPDQFFDAAFDLAKAVDRVARLAADDRFPQNAEKVAAKHRGDLLRARDVLVDVLARMP